MLSILDELQLEVEERPNGRTWSWLKVWLRLLQDRLQLRGSSISWFPVVDTRPLVSSRAILCNGHFSFSLLEFGEQLREMLSILDELQLEVEERPNGCRRLT
jgi:hypothetical protein